MAEYHLLRCSVALAGDRDQVVVRHRHDPIMFPELIVLQYLHGEDAITDVHVVGTCEMAIDEAWTRLLTIYGEDAVKAVFPGARPMVPRKDDTIPLCSKPIYVSEPTLPANPDPKLRPLDTFTMPARMPRRAAPNQPAEADPTPDEIAAHVQDDEGDEVTDKQMAEMGLTSPDLMQSGRLAYPGQTATHTPPADVASNVDRRRRREPRHEAHGG
jgi:hypothetical protein